MPKARGIAWAALADEIREGATHLDRQLRLTVCASLAAIVSQLEQKQCCHRDLSAGNVFALPDRGDVVLIDFDSLYHPSLPMPPATTAGTEGYVAPFARRNGGVKPSATWCAHSDRYALALLIVEILVMCPGAPLTAEGGLFEQSELCRRCGPGLTLLTRQLDKELPAALPLLKAALDARSFEDCPSPENWLDSLGREGATTRPQLTNAWARPRFVNLWRRGQGRSAPVPASVPRLSEMPVAIPSLPKPGGSVVALPSDPWQE